ncbi:MAG: sialidase family protein, partial [Acidimicrobiales bacterium]
MTIRKWARRAMSVATVVAVGAGISVPGPGAGQAVAGPPPTADVAVTGKVGVTDAYQNPSLATDPTNSRRLAVAYFEGHALNRCYLGLSNDGGTTWDTRLLLGEGGQYPLPNPATTWCLNPVVAFGPDATLYYVAQAALPNGRVGDQVKLYASTDGGLTFRGPTTADPGETMRGYWPSVAVDQRRGRVYVAWSRHPGPPVPGRVLVSFSDDKGATLSPPVLASPPEEMFPAAPQIAVGPDGALYVVYGSEIDNVVHTTVSVDGGTSFAPSVEIIELAPVRTFGAGPPVTNRLTASFGPRYMAIVAGSQPGRAALSFWDVSGPGGLGRVSVTSTADGGRTWSLPRPVGTPPGREGDHQINSFMSAAPNGRLDVAYYVRRGAEWTQEFNITSSSYHPANVMAAPKMNQVTSS